MQSNNMHQHTLPMSQPVTIRCCIRILPRSRCRLFWRPGRLFWLRQAGALGHLARPALAAAGAAAQLHGSFRGAAPCQRARRCCRPRAILALCRRCAGRCCWERRGRQPHSGGRSRCCGRQCPVGPRSAVGGCYGCWKLRGRRAAGRGAHAEELVLERVRRADALARVVAQHLRAKTGGPDEHKASMCRLSTEGRTENTPCMQCSVLHSVLPALRISSWLPQACMQTAVHAPVTPW